MRRESIKPMMYEDYDENTRIVNGRPVDTKKIEITRCCVGEFEVGTNGLYGGDSGHGSRTYIRYQDLGGTDINIVSTGNGVAIELGGDDELNSLIEGMEFMLETLKEQIAYNKGLNDRL